MRKTKEPKTKSALAIGNRRISVGHKIALILFSLMLFILILFPFYWIILSSFKNFLEIF